MRLGDCKSECAKADECEGVVVAHGSLTGGCWLRKNVELSKCQLDPAWDLWLKQAPASQTLSQPAKPQDDAAVTIAEQDPEGKADGKAESLRGRSSSSSR